MGQALNKLTIRGFKSIKDLENFELKKLNVLIGGNGAGKSNFVEVFTLLREMEKENLRGYIANRGGAYGFCFDGPKYTDRILMHFSFGDNDYKFELEPTVNEEFLIAEESAYFRKPGYSDSFIEPIGRNNKESKLKESKDKPGRKGGSSNNQTGKQYTPF